MECPFELKGKVALVTGGATGLGLGIARQFIALGASVAITGRNPDKLEKAKSELGDRCYVVRNDVTDKPGHPALIQEVEQALGPLDILVNNAGVHKKAPSLEITDDDFHTVMDTNLNSVFSLTREALRVMVPRGAGSVIMISSMAALYGLPYVAAYSGSKTALLGLTRSLSVEYSWSGVRINAIAPGFIESKMLRKAMEQDPKRKERVLERTPMRRFGTPDEIGYAAAFLASDASKFITGACLPVDGGNAIGF